MLETSEEAFYLLEMAQADFKVWCHEKDLTEQLLHQFHMQKQHLWLWVKKAKRNFGDMEANVGCTHALMVRCGFLCSEQSLWSPCPKSTIKSCKWIFSQNRYAVADEYSWLEYLSVGCWISDHSLVPCTWLSIHICIAHFIF
jgi:hypothetical protein